MTTATIRKKLHDYINIADDKKVKAIYTIVEDEMESGNGIISEEARLKTKKIELMKQASSDPLFLADLKEIRDDFDVVDTENI